MCTLSIHYSIHVYKQVTQDHAGTLEPYGCLHCICPILRTLQVIDTATRCTSRGIDINDIRSFLQAAIEAALKLNLNRQFAGFLEDIRDSFSVSKLL